MPAGSLSYLHITDYSSLGYLWNHWDMTKLKVFLFYVEWKILYLHLYRHTAERLYFLDTLSCFEVCVFHSERQEVYAVISREQETENYKALMETSRLDFIF